jgi:BirA family biotin operon repressor/biotin-[acetyl-CoA-carboxylase] ligase
MPGSGHVDTNRLVSQLKANGWQWPTPKFLPSVGSTNEVLLGESPEEGTCLIAGEQTEGRGRGTNTWQAPADTSLLLSIALRPQIPVASWPWAGVLLALAAHSASGRYLSSEFETVLKWPNDIMVRETSQPSTARKLGGVLSQSADGFCVTGVGLNVFQTPAQFGGLESAVSLSMVGQDPISITDLAMLLLSSFQDSYLNWQSQWSTIGDEGVRQRYLRACQTVGAEVDFIREGKQFVGRAIDVDSSGQLSVRLPDGQVLGLNSQTTISVRDVEAYQ